MNRLLSFLVLVTLLILSQGGFAPTKVWSTPPDACVGACCYPDGTCSDSQTQEECENQGGTFMGDGTSCDQVDCGAAIPTLTEWGLILFGLALLGFITWMFLKRKKASVSSS